MKQYYTITSYKIDQNCIVQRGVPYTYIYIYLYSQFSHGRTGFTCTQLGTLLDECRWVFPPPPQCGELARAKLAHQAPSEATSLVQAHMDRPDRPFLTAFGLRKTFWRPCTSTAFSFKWPQALGDLHFSALWGLSLTNVGIQGAHTPKKSC